MLVDEVVEWRCGLFLGPGRVGSTGDFTQGNADGHRSGKILTG